jgi:L-alanine-DL-glutamate epimerase-like enolase superfamily enzyme
MKIASVVCQILRIPAVAFSASPSSRRRRPVEDWPLRHEPTVEKLQSVDGWIDVPDRPGLGVTLDEAVVNRFLVAESA